MFPTEGMVFGHSPYFVEGFLSREAVHAMVAEHLHLKKKVSDRINSYAQILMKSHAIGIHYRGTDKIIEAPRIPYETVLETVEQWINGLESDYQIFVATDEEDFLSFMQSHFGEAVVFQKEAARSSDGKALHRGTATPYEQGLEALVDCILLSKCDILFRTSSNLSRWSLYFNPDLQEIPMSHRNSYYRRQASK